MREPDWTSLWIIFGGMVYTLGIYVFCVILFP